MSPCVYDCRHVLWKGRGVCVEDADGEHHCLCDEGYSNENALEQPDCELKAVKVAAYWIIIILSLLTLVTAVYSLRRQALALRALGIQENKISLQDKVKRRFSRGSVVWGIWVSIMYILLLSEAFTFIQLLPGFTVHLCLQTELGQTTVELWMSVLPTSRMEAGSLAYKICELVKDGRHLWWVTIPQNILYVLACVWGSSGHPVPARFPIQSVTLFEVLTLIIVIDIVSWSLYHIVRKAELDSSVHHFENSAKEYHKSLSKLIVRTIEINVLAGTLLGILCVTLFVPFGINTPLLFFVCGHGISPSVWILLVFSSFMREKKGSAPPIKLTNVSGTAVGSELNNPNPSRMVKLAGTINVLAKIKGRCKAVPPRVSVPSASASVLGVKIACSSEIPAVTSTSDSMVVEPYVSV